MRTSCNLLRGPTAAQAEPSLRRCAARSVWPLATVSRGSRKRSRFGVRFNLDIDAFQLGAVDRDPLAMQFAAERWQRRCRRAIQPRLQLLWNQIECQPGLSLLKAHSRSEEHTSELQSLMRISYAVLCLQKKKNKTQ